MTKRICSVPGCERAHEAHGYCRAHYRRWQQTGDPGPVEIQRKSPPPPDGLCIVAVCEYPAKTRGYCTGHYARFRQTGDAGTSALKKRSPRGSNTICTIEDCGRAAKCRGLCVGHYSRWRKTGATGAAELREQMPAGACTVCTVNGCDRPHKARGYCNAHLFRWRKGGDPGVPQVRERRDPNARDEQGRKFCVGGAHWTPEEEFHRDSRTADGYNGRCRRCQRDGVLRRTYNITLDEYEAMVAAQDGRCAICSLPPESGGSLHIDHDHACCPDKCKSCGECIRGLLCSPCNTALGLLRDDVSRLSAAMNYLTR